MECLTTSTQDYLETILTKTLKWLQFKIYAKKKSEKKGATNQRGGTPPHLFLETNLHVQPPRNTERTN
jgi:hypothetical protein